MPSRRAGGFVVEDIDDFLVGEADSRPGVLFFWFCRWAACELQLKYFLDMLSRYRRDFKTPQPGGLIFTQPRDIFAKQRRRIVAQQERGGPQSRDDHSSFLHTQRSSTKFVRRPRASLPSHQSESSTFKSRISTVYVPSAAWRTMDSRAGEGSKTGPTPLCLSASRFGK